MQTTLAHRIHRLAHNDYWAALSRCETWHGTPWEAECWRELGLARDVLEMASEGL